MTAKRLLVVLSFAVTLSACAPFIAEHYPYRPEPYPSGPGAWNAAADYASRTGFQDGRDLGYSDGRDGDRYEPRSHRRYRAGDHGYRRDLYVSRDHYADAYRRAFLSGYEAGYRQGQDERRRRRW
jgi:hypothetical protein